MCKKLTVIVSTVRVLLDTEDVFRISSPSKDVSRGGSGEGEAVEDRLKEFNPGDCGSSVV